MRLILVSLILTGSFIARAEEIAEPAHVTNANSGDAAYACGGDCNHTSYQAPITTNRNEDNKTIQELSKDQNGVLKPEQLQQGTGTSENKPQGI